MYRPPARSLQATAADGCMWCTLESQCWDTGPGGRPLDGLQLEEWSESNAISSNEALTGIACLADPDPQLPRWGCQSPLLADSSAAQQPVCQPWLMFPRSADEVGSQLQRAGPPLVRAHVSLCAQAADPLSCPVAQL